MRMTFKMVALISLTALGSGKALEASSPNKQATIVLHGIFGKQGTPKRDKLKGSTFEPAARDQNLDEIKNFLWTIDVHGAYVAAQAGTAAPDKAAVEKEIAEEMEKALTRCFDKSSLKKDDISKMVKKMVTGLTIPEFKREWPLFKKLLTDLTTLDAHVLTAYAEVKKTNPQPTVGEVWTEVEDTMSEMLRKNPHRIRAAADRSAKLTATTKPLFEAFFSYLTTLDIQAAYDAAKAKKKDEPEEADVWTEMEASMTAKLKADYKVTAANAPKLLTTITKPLFTDAYKTFVPGANDGNDSDLKKKSSSSMKFWVITGLIGGGLAYWYKTQKQDTAKSARVA